MSFIKLFVLFISFHSPSLLLYGLGSTAASGYDCSALWGKGGSIIHLRRQHNKHPHISQQTLSLWPTENDSILCVSLISTLAIHSSVSFWPSGSDLAATPSCPGATDGVSTHELGVMTLRGASPKASSINCPHGNGCQPPPHTHTRVHTKHTHPHLIIRRSSN